MGKGVSEDQDSKATNERTKPMKPTHTPGPWQWTAVAGGWDGVIGPTGLAICKLVENNPENARLIATAPELLEALKAAVRLENDRRAGCQFGAADYAELHQQLTQAITKATGGAS